MLVDEGGLNLSPGEPPRAVAGASPSGPAQRTAVGGREDEDGLVLREGALARLRDVGQPVDFAPGTFPGLGLDESVQPIEFRGRKGSGSMRGCPDRGHRGEGESESENDEMT